MLKRLAILCLIAGMEVAFSGQSPTVRVNPSGKQKQESKTDAPKANNDQRGTQASPFVVDVKKPEKTKQETEEEKAEKDHKEFIDRWTLRFALAVAVTAVLQVVGVGLQIAIFRKQTLLMTGALAAAQNSAEAAKLNAQAIINAERPWLLVVVKSQIGPLGGFTVHVRNKGRTPAMITAAHIGCAAVKSISALPDKAPFGPGNLMQGRIVIPEGAARIIWFDAGVLARILKDDFPQFSWDGEVYVFGKVLYRDLLNPTPAVEHETRWIGLYQRPVGDVGNSIFRIQGIGIPDEYDRHT